MRWSHPERRIIRFEWCAFFGGLLCHTGHGWRFERSLPSACKHAAEDGFTHIRWGRTGPIQAIPRRFIPQKGDR